MLRVPDSHATDRTLQAGPLQVRVAAGGAVRVGWMDAEPDWLGPGSVIAPDGIAGTTHALPDEPVVVLRLEATVARRDLATGDFGTPAVAWHFEPRLRAD